MYRIIKIGMDVHSKNYTLCAMEPTIGAEDRIFGEVQVAPDYKEVICFIESLKMKLSSCDDYSIECGYEAGCLGYTLYHQLTGAGIKCVILAPTTMLTQQGKRIKTDKRDARLIAQCLCYGGYLYFVKCFSQKSERKIPNFRNGIFPYISRKHFHMIVVQSVA